MSRKEYEWLDGRIVNVKGALMSLSLALDFLPAPYDLPELALKIRKLEADLRKVIKEAQEKIDEIERVMEKITIED